MTGIEYWWREKGNWDGELVGKGKNEVGGAREVGASRLVVG